MTFNHPSPLNNRAFQEYREPIPEPIELSDDESQVTNRQPFIMEGIEQEQRQGQGQGQGQDMNTAILTALTQLLKNQENQRGPMFRPKLREPDTYHGTRTPHAAESWLRSVQRYADVTGMDEVDRVQYAINLFRGDADTWWRTREIVGHDASTWIDFCKLVLDEFRPRNAKQTARDRLAALTQTGTVEEYVNDFRNLWLEIPTMTDDEALDRFVRGLAENVQVYVRTQFPTTTAQAERIAFAYEGAMSLHQNAADKMTRLEPPRQPSRDVEYMDLDAVQTRYRRNDWRTPRTFSRRDNRMNQEPPRCYNCGGLGHLQRSCPSNLPGEWRYRPASQRPGNKHLKDEARRM